MNSEEKRFLLRLARESISTHLRGQEVITSVPDNPVFQRKAGGFVTLHKNGNLRGCIGFVKAVDSVYNTVKRMAVAAATEDPRFPTVGVGELNDVSIEISILSEMNAVTNENEIVIGRDGLFIVKDFYSGLLLPQVAIEHNFDVETLLRETCIKAGLPKYSWKENGTKIFRFSAEIFSEREFCNNL